MGRKIQEFKMKKELVFDLDIYSREAIMATLDVYKKVKEITISEEENNNKIKVIILTDSKNRKEDKKEKDLEIIKNEFSNYALGLTKELVFKSS